jgi:hypothetical protein
MLLSSGGYFSFHNFCYTQTFAFLLLCANVYWQRLAVTPGAYFCCQLPPPDYAANFRC